MIVIFFCSQSPANLKRLAGYDIDPLRIDIMTTIEHSKLVHMHLCKDLLQRVCSALIQFDCYQHTHEPIHVQLYDIIRLYVPFPGWSWNMMKIVGWISTVLPLSCWMLTIRYMCMHVHVCIKVKLHVHMYMSLQHWHLWFFL